jgi:hypothetical protein
MRMWTMGFQQAVWDWLHSAFGRGVAVDPEERNHRFLEEALELVQSTGLPRDQAHALVDYVYDRPAGETRQEVGGTFICLAALCSAHGINLGTQAYQELNRCWDNVDRIRAKHAGKPKLGRG